MNKAIRAHFGKVLALLGFVGLVASFWQTAEKIHFLQNPDEPLSCNLNPIVDCGAVLNHSLSSVFGPPNSLIGVVMFSSISVLGLLVALRLKPNMMMKALILILTTVIFTFSVWFFAVSLYEINKACIFCMFIWAAAIPMFVYSWAQYGKDVLGKVDSKILRLKLQMIEKHPDRFVVGLYSLALIMYFTEFKDYYF